MLHLRAMASDISGVVTTIVAAGGGIITGISTILGAIFVKRLNRPIDDADAIQRRADATESLTESVVKLVARAEASESRVDTLTTSLATARGQLYDALMRVRELSHEVESLHGEIERLKRHVCEGGE